MEENSIEEDIKIALDKFLDNKDIESAIFIVEKFILGNYVLVGGRKNIVKDSLRYILTDYKRVLRENERYQKSDYETICLENNELREITDRIQSEYNDLLKDNFKLKDELETKRKEYQETYKDVRKELKELKKENEKLKKELNEENKKCMMLAVEKQDYFEKYKYHLQQNESLTRKFSNDIPVQEVKDLKNRILENEEYTVVLEGDKEFPDSTTETTFEKYINLKVLDELIERGK